MAEKQPYKFDKRGVKAAFNRAAAAYDEVAVLQRTIAQRMLERLDFFAIQPRWILDAGTGTGTAARHLAARYKKARVLGCDLAFNMLVRAKCQTTRIWSRQRYLCADLESLPLADASVDMIFSNLAVQWCDDLDKAFLEFRRVLRPGGLLLFTTFGPDTLTELRASWAAVDTMIHVHAFMDMHDIGDALIRAGLSSPVLDVEVLTLTYSDVYALMRDLKALGAANRSHGRRRTLTGKAMLQALASAYEQFRREGRLPATHEVVYGHAWAPEAGTRPQDGSTVATFPLTKLKRIERRG